MLPMILMLFSLWWSNLKVFLWPKRKLGTLIWSAVLVRMTHHFNMPSKMLWVFNLHTSIQRCFSLNPCSLRGWKKAHSYHNCLSTLYPLLVNMNRTKNSILRHFLKGDFISVLWGNSWARTFSYTKDFFHNMYLKWHCWQLTKHCIVQGVCSDQRLVECFGGKYLCFSQPFRSTFPHHSSCSNDYCRMKWPSHWTSQLNPRPLMANRPHHPPLPICQLWE